MKNIPNTTHAKFKQKYIWYYKDWLYVYEYVHLGKLFHIAGAGSDNVVLFQP